MLSQTTCPPDALLQGYLRDALEHADSASVDDHLDACPKCLQRLSDLSHEIEMASGEGHLQTLTHRGPGSNTPPSRGSAPDSPGRSTSIAESPKPDVVKLIGPYEILGVLGRGGMGIVFDTLHTRLRRRAALKIIAPQRNDERGVQRFNREMALIGKLQHPHIVQAYDAGEIHGRPYLVMELVEGRDVETVARGAGPLAVADVCEIIRQAAIGLAHAHSHGLIHRDIKPSNLLLSRAGVVKVADLGLARVADQDAPGEEITSQSCFLGTADYASPEQARSQRKIDARADLYSLGCAMHRLLAGKPPFPSPRYNTPLKKLMAHARAAPPALSSQREDVPAAVCEIVARLLQKNPGNRFASGLELAVALEPFAAGARLDQLGEQAFRTASNVASSPCEEDLKWLETPDTSPSKPPPKLQRVGSNLHRMIAAALMALMLGGALWALWSIVRKPGYYELLSAHEVRRDTLYPLLNVSPQPWVMRNDAKIRVENSRLFVNASERTLLKIADAPFDAYEFEVDLLQRGNDWTGDVGICFGAREYFEKVNQPVWEIQCIFLKRRYDLPPNHEQFPFALICRTFWVRNRNGEISVTSYDPGSVKIRPPNPAGARLRLEVLNSQLTRVQWEGVDYPELCKHAKHAKGGIGIAAEQCSCEFYNARLTVR